MNKKIALVLTGIMIIGSLTGCNGKNNNSNEAESAASTASSAAAEGDVDTSIALFNGLDNVEKMPLSEVNPDEFVTLGEYKGVTVEVRQFFLWQWPAL